MAELIPLEYRIRAARRDLIRRWGIAVGLALAVAGAGLLQSYMWKRGKSAEYARTVLGDAPRSTVRCVRNRSTRTGCAGESWVARVM